MDGNMFACVRYLRGNKQDIVHISRIKNFQPKSVNDFKKGKLYEVDQFDVDSDAETQAELDPDKCFIFKLGELDEVQDFMSRKRLPIPPARLRSPYTQNSKHSNGKVSKTKDTRKQNLRKVKKIAQENIKNIHLANLQSTPLYDTEKDISSDDGDDEDFLPHSEKVELEALAARFKENTELNNKNCELKARLSESEKRNDLLERKVAELTEHLAEAEERNKKYVAEIEELNARKVDLLNQITDYLEERFSQNEKRMETMLNEFLKKTLTSDKMKENSQSTNESCVSDTSITEIPETELFQDSEMVEDTEGQKQASGNSDQEVSTSRSFGIFEENNGNVDLGNGVAISSVKWETILKSQKPSLFINNLSAAVFGTGVLAFSSVTGKPSNRFQGTVEGKTPLCQKKNGNHKRVLQVLLERTQEAGASGQ